MEHILDLLIARRRQLGLSQQALAVRAGLRREKLNRVESRGEDIGLADFARLLDAVGLEMDVREKRPAVAGILPESRGLEPARASQAALVDGAKVRIVNWGKVPR
jgi:transcriptional regulator with XRE-family HTH domain